MASKPQRLSARIDERGLASMARKHLQASCALPLPRPTGTASYRTMYFEEHVSVNILVSAYRLHLVLFRKAQNRRC